MQSFPAPRLMAAAGPPPGGFGDPAGRRWAVLGVAAAHLLAAWMLTRLEVVRDAVREVLPVTVVLLGPQQPPAPRTVEIAPPPLPPRPVPLAAAPMVVPTVPLLAPTTVAPAAAIAAPVVVAPPAPAAAPSAITVSAPTPPPAPPPAPQRKQVAHTAVRYLVEPPFEVPRASRRAGEHGTVVLRVVVSVLGLPIQVSVQRSSGFPRLDEQAVWAMRQARFQPYTEDGRALEVEALAPVEYPAE